MPKTDQSFDPLRYATVAERITLFRRAHPNGRIITELVQRDDRSVTFKATVYRDETDALPAATGWAAEKEGDGDINAVACLENTETSAIGRALANLGFTASRERPSREEMERAARARAHRMPRADAVSESPAAWTSSAPTLQRRDELLALLADAEAFGLDRARAERLRQRLTAHELPSPDRLTRIERGLRTWVREHDPVTAIRHLL